MKRYLFRIEFTREEYYNRALKFHFDHFTLQTIIQWTILLLMIAMFLKLLPFFQPFICIWGRAIHIKHYDIFISTPIIGYVAYEKIWFDSFSQLVKYQSGMIKVAYEMAASLDDEFSRLEKFHLLTYYNQLNHYLGKAYTFNCFCLCPLALQLLYWCFYDYLHSLITCSQLFCFTVLSVAMNLYAAYVLGTLFVILPDFTFVLKIFRLKLDKCRMFLRYTSPFLSGQLLSKLINEYIKLHRHLQMYNQSICGQIHAEDLVFKLSGIVVWIFYIKEDEPLNHVSYIILFTYTAAYCIFQLIISTLGYFPEQNYRCYLYLSSLNARSQWNPGLTRRASQFKRKIELRKILKMDSFSHFLSSGRFGFTHGTLYILTKKAIFSAILNDCYLLILFYKRLTV